MPFEVRLVNDEVFADSVDVKRVARKLKKLTNVEGFTPPQDMNQALELVARMLDFPSTFALRQTARNHTTPVSAGSLKRSYVEERAEHMVQLLQAFWSGSQIGLPLIELVTPGIDFPKELPAEFGPDWQAKAVKLMAEALEGCNQDRVELVLLAGKSGAGKSLLARHTAQANRGLVLNYALDTMNHSGLRAALEQNPPLLCYDAGAWDAEYLHRRTADRHPQMGWNPGAPAHPDAQLPAMFFGFNHSNIVQLVSTRPGFVAIVSVQNVEFGLQECFSVFGAVGNIIDAVRVVNLDTMTFETVTAPRTRPEPYTRAMKGPYVQRRE